MQRAPGNPPSACHPRLRSAPRCRTLAPRCAWLEFPSPRFARRGGADLRRVAGVPRAGAFSARRDVPSSAAAIRFRAAGNCS